MKRSREIMLWYAIMFTQIANQSIFESEARKAKKLRDKRYLSNDSLNRKTEFEVSQTKDLLKKLHFGQDKFPSPGRTIAYFA